MDLFDIAVASKLAGGGGGGGGSSYTLLASKEFEISTTSTSASIVGDISIPELEQKKYILFFEIRDKAGAREDHCYGSDTFGYLIGSSFQKSSYCYYMNGVVMSLTSGQYGIYPTRIDNGTTVVIAARYNSTTKTIDGTFVVNVYALEWPGGVSPFN